MTSKISFFKLVRDEQKKLAWVTALMGLVFGLLIPFRVLVTMAVANSEYQVREAGKLERLTEVFWRQIGFGHLENTLFILLAGAFCALCAFGYVHSAVKLDFFHSLALKRETLFGAKALGSILTFVIPYAVSQLLALLAGLPYGIDVGKGAAEVLAAAGQGILYFLVSYGGTLVAVMLTGKMMTTVFAAGVMCCYVPLIYVFVIMLSELFLYTSLLEEDLVNCTAGALWYTSPWTICVAHSVGEIGTGKQGITGFWPDQSGICVLLLLVIVLFLISLLLYRFRKTERAGSALAFRHTEMPVKLALVIPSAVAAGVVGYEIFMSVIWAFIFIALFGTLLCMIMEFIYRWDIRQVLVHKGQMFISILAALLIFCGFRYDLSGYNTCLPDKEEISSMAVCDLDLPTGYLVEGRWDDSTRSALDHLETEQFDQIYALAENGVENAGEWRGYNYYTSDGDYWFVGIKYHLKNGREIYRKYRVEQELLNTCMDAVWSDEQLRRKYFPVLDIDVQDISYACAYFISPSEEQKDIAENESESYDAEYAEETDENGFAEFTSKEEIQKLLEVYQEDLSRVSYRDCMYRNGNVEFQISGESDSWISCPIGDTWTETLKLCRKNTQKYRVTG